MISVAPTLTEQGYNLMLRGIAGETITFVRMEIGNGELVEGMDPRELTALINPLVSFGIADIDKSNSGYVKITGSFDNTDITQDFRWTEFGVYACGETCQVFSGNGSAKTFTLSAKPPAVNSVKVGGVAVTVSSYNSSTGVVTLLSAPATGTDNVVIRYPDTPNTTLYGVVNDGDDAGKLKANATAVVTEQTVGFIVAIGQATSVTAILSDSVIYATKAELDAHISAINPHGIDKVTVGLGNVPNVSTNDQTPTYTTPSTLSEMTSGETVATVFGKLRRLIINFMSHLTATNPHGISAAGINAAAREHTHAASDINSGVLGVSRGGTGASSYAVFKANAGITTDINNAVSLLKTMVAATDLTLEQSYNSEVPWVYIQSVPETDDWIKVTALKSSNACGWCIYGDMYGFYDYITGGIGSFSEGETVWLHLKYENNQYKAYVMHKSITPAQYAVAYAQRGF